jgi:hypothetical protein
MKYVDNRNDYVMSEVATDTTLSTLSLVPPLPV